MTEIYTLPNAGPGVIDPSGQRIPADPTNAGWQVYQNWLAAGNKPAAASAPIPLMPLTLQIISTSTPSLNGTYAIDATAQQRMIAVATYIAIHNAFPNNLTIMPWPDASGVMRNFPTMAEFVAFATAVENFIVAWTLGQNPMQPVTIV